MKFLTLILACVALAGCKPKKLSYRDPFYFGDKQTHGVLIANTATTDTIKRTGDYSAQSLSTPTNNYGFSGRVPGQDGLRYDTIHQSLDTVKVIGYCLDTATLKVEWRRLYGVYGWGKPSVNFNGLMIYHNYLMPDRKTPSIYKVIYSINSK